MKLIAINTIGLTGAEILCAELARHPEIRMLPGQNFIRFKNVCYRPHDYDSIAASEIFEMLSMHHYTRSGKCWSGLTKSMSPAMLARYDSADHRSRFEESIQQPHQFLDLVQSYIETFYQSLGLATDQTNYVGWFGNNIAANAVAYPGFDERAVVINFSNPLDYWLANINQRFPWNNLDTLKFWIANQLFLHWFASARDNYFSVDIREYTLDRDGTSRRLREFLNLPTNVPLDDNPPDGFIRFNDNLVHKIEADAILMRAIYADHALYKVAASIENWAPRFLADPQHVKLLRDYGAFWNSTSHTNLDWVGPIEEEIAEIALELTGCRTSRNKSLWFYHDCFELNCDHYLTPKSRLEHYLGSIEAEIVLPRLPYFARIVVCYLESVVDNCLRRPYSAFRIRETNLYQRLTAPDYACHFPLWAMTEKVAALEHLIDQADAAMNGYYPVAP